MCECTRMYIVMGMEPRALNMLGKHPTFKLCPQFHLLIKMFNRIKGIAVPSMASLLKGRLLVYIVEGCIYVTGQMLK